MEVVPADAEVFDDVGDYSSWHVASMPCKSNKTLGAERVGIMSVAASGAKEFATDFIESMFQLPAIQGRVFAHILGCKDKLVAEGGWDGAARFHQGFEVRLGGELKTEDGFSALLPVRVAARQQRGLGYPLTILVAANLNFGNRYYHREGRLACHVASVKCYA